MYQILGGCSSTQSVNEFEKLKLASCDLLGIAWGSLLPVTVKKTIYYVLYRLQKIAQAFWSFVSCPQEESCWSFQEAVDEATKMKREAIPNCRKFENVFTRRYVKVIQNRGTFKEHWVLPTITTSTVCVFSGHLRC